MQWMYIVVIPPLLGLVVGGAVWFVWGFAENTSVSLKALRAARRAAAAEEGE